MKKLVLLIVIVLLCAMTSCGQQSEDVVSQTSSSSQVETEEETETTVEETEEPTTEEETEAEKDTSWKKLYIEFLNSLDRENYCGYELVYIDDDDTPELVVLGGAHVIPGYICWTYDGELHNENIPYLGFSYFERENRYLCRNMFTGAGTDTIYELDGAKAKKVKSGSLNTNLDNESYNWDGTKYSNYDEYEAALHADFDTNSAQSVDSTKSYTEICKEIRDY